MQLADIVFPPSEFEIRMIRDESMEAEGSEKWEDSILSPTQLRLPNDLIYQLVVREGAEGGTGIGGGECSALQISSSIPALVNLSGGSSAEETLANLKYGYSYKTKVPLTCMETGMCFNVQLQPKMVN